MSVLHTSLMIGDMTITIRSPDRERVSLCGVASSPIDDAGVVWMCATDDIYQYQMAFLRKRKAELEYLAQDYMLLHNYVEARNTLHLKWLRWTGFTLINKHTKFGAEKRLFYKFLRTT